MPTLVNAETDERGALPSFLDAQRGGLRRAALGLTEELAAAAPTVSTSRWRCWCGTRPAPSGTGSTR